MPKIAKLAAAAAVMSVLSGCFTDAILPARNVVRDGSSVKAAIPVAGVDAEYAWLSANRPGWRPLRQTLLLGGPGEAYDLFLIGRGGAREEIYFDISAFYDRG